jgi:hypothetical protein
MEGERSKGHGAESPRSLALATDLGAVATSTSSLGLTFPNCERRQLHLEDQEQGRPSDVFEVLEFFFFLLLR